MLSSGDWAGEKRDGEDEEGDKGNHPLGNENQIVTKPWKTNVSKMTNTWHTEHR